MQQNPSFSELSLSFHELVFFIVVGPSKKSCLHDVKCCETQVQTMLTMFSKALIGRNDHSWLKSRGIIYAIFLNQVWQA